MIWRLLRGVLASRLRRQAYCWSIALSMLGGHDHAHTNNFTAGTRDCHSLDASVDVALLFRSEDFGTVTRQASYSG